MKVDTGILQRTLIYLDHNIQEMELDKEAVKRVITMLETRNTPTPPNVSEEPDKEDNRRYAKKYREKAVEEGKCRECHQDRRDWSPQRCFECARKHGIYQAKREGRTEFVKDGKYGDAGEPFDGPVRKRQCVGCERIYSGVGISMKYLKIREGRGYLSGKCSECIKNE